MPRTRATAPSEPQRGTRAIIRYGLRVSVLRVPAPGLLTTPEALRTVGPAAFGYGDTEYRRGEGIYGARSQDRHVLAGHVRLRPGMLRRD